MGRKKISTCKGHLLGKQLGGNGRIEENLVTLYQNPANHPVMSGIEHEVRKAVEKGEVIEYSVKPIFDKVTEPPIGITIEAKGNQGFELATSILNNK